MAGIDPFCGRAPLGERRDKVLQLLPEDAFAAVACDSRYLLLLRPFYRRGITRSWRQTNDL